MNVALDFDGTYTRDPDRWNDFIKLMRRAGHKIYVVTMRYDNEHEGEPVKQALGDKVDCIFFTERKAKASFMSNLVIRIDVWIDDQPFFIYQDALA